MAPVVGVDVYRGSDIVRGPAEIDPPGGRAHLVAGRADEDVRPLPEPCQGQAPSWTTGRQKIGAR